MAKGFTFYFSRYSLVTLLPAFVVATIYADYNHTKQWKKKLLPVEE